MIGHITDPSADGGIARRELSEPDVESHDTLVEVRAYSVNRGELGLLERRPEGWRPGQDVAGVVIAQAPDGTGPPAGTRVTGHAEGGSWSERVNVPSNRLGIVPDNVSFADAAGLPAAGLTALRALRAGGSLLGRKVLVTGASGGVGQFAVQLATLGGAEVTALVSGPHRFESLAGFGVEPVSTLEEAGPFDVVLDGVGGQVLMDAIHGLAPGGIILAYGVASGETSNFAFRDFPWGEVNSLVGFYLWATPEATFGQDLTYLAGLIGKDQLDVRSSVRWDWSETAKAVEMLRSRQATGKVILTIS
jgi:NADPH:quinone reductase-like Zn-dependent oxidoreductase